MMKDLVQQALRAHPQIELAILFGSHATGRAHADSDVDVAVMFSHEMSSAQRMALIADLAEATGGAIDLIDLRTVGEPLLGQILEHGQRIHGSDDVYAQLVSRHLVDAADFLPYVRRMLAERRQAWIGL
ncbi:MAG TPA: nucleotidyltransferase domain-containing protein [Ideonella sp.]|nr:nucleotidyltransferase domain-containing protein [Ideonella sp.]